MIRIYLCIYFALIALDYVLFFLYLYDTDIFQLVYW